MECLCCAKCCVILADRREKVKEWVLCKWNKNKLCSVYDTRLGRDLGDGVHKCGLREGVKMNYPGCPYNIEGQELHPAYR